MENIEQSSRVFILILAAGSGSRFSSDQKKQFIKLKNLPLFLWSLKFFLQDINLNSHISLVYSQGDLQSFQELLQKYLPFQTILKIHLVEGGQTRNQSVYFGVKKLVGAAKNPKDIVLIHDAARPFVQKNDIVNIMQALKQYPAVSLGYIPTDTIKIINPNNQELVEDLCRANLRALLTPQAFYFSILWEAYQDYQKNAFLTTDDTEVIHNLGYPVKVVAGDPRNIKITYIDDLKKAEINSFCL